jgi:predicted nucleic acid-binding protein
MSAEVAIYADTSALVKLVVAESETRALESWVRRTSSVLMSSDLVRTELTRAVRRGDPDRLVRARAVLDGVSLLRISSDTYEAAGRLDPASLRSLDALHLAAAIALGDDLEAMLTYDERLAAAATAYGIAVVTPR